VVDGRHRQQVEVDLLCVRLVDAHSVEEHAHALRGADDRRDLKAAHLELGLEARALVIVEGHAWQLLQRPKRRIRALGDVLQIHGFDLRRDALVDVRQARAGHHHPCEAPSRAVRLRRVACGGVRLLGARGAVPNAKRRDDQGDAREPHESRRHSGHRGDAPPVKR